MQKLLEQSEKNLLKEFETSVQTDEVEEQSEEASSIYEESDIYTESYEESYTSSEDESSVASSVLPDPQTVKWHHKLFATRTIKGAGKDGADLPPWWMKDYGEHGKLTTEEVMEKFRKKMKIKKKALAKIYRRRERRKRKEEEREQRRLRKHYFDVKVNRIKREKAEKNAILSPALGSNPGRQLKPA